MYCPKCGGQNSDDLAYCRECGENLKVIAQVMKGHAPLTIASKIDAVFQRKNERLRREGILWTFTGLVAVAWALYSGSLISFGNELFQIVSSIIVPILCFYLGAGNYLAYRRSLELESGPSASKLITSADATDNPESARVFCAKCGIPNSEVKQFCSSCGFPLVFEPSGMEKYLPGFVIRWLDRRIRHNEEYLAVPRQGWRVLAPGLGMAVIAVSMGLQGKTGMAALYSFIAVSTFVTTGWDYLTYLRTAKPEFVAASQNYESTWQQLRAFARKPEIKPKLLLAASFLLFSFAAPFIFGSTAVLLGAPIFSLIAVGALILNFNQFQSENHKRRMENSYESPNRELSSNETPQLDSNLDSPQQVAAADEFRNPNGRDTVRFASPPGSVTEDTTKHLTALSELNQDESRTTSKLKNDLDS